MKLLVNLFTMQKNGAPSVTSQSHKLGKGCSLSIVQPGDVGDVPSFKIIRVGFFKFEIEVKSDNYRKFAVKVFDKGKP